MWDWVGGRTSMMSAVGLFPAALAGVDCRALLKGAATMDAWTRQPDRDDNPAMMMALSWYGATNGCADRANVVLPYCDRLELLAKYLQQLIMESLGKRLNRLGETVNQGLTVFGNKGATDQHAYVQQLREGPDDHFVTFIEVLRPSSTIAEREVRPGVRADDVLSALLAGTRTALGEVGRRHMTLTLRQLDAERFGALIALFERTVGFYASLVNINAYHQPGVEAGKRVAAEVLKVQASVEAALAGGQSGTAATFARELGIEESLARHVLRRLEATGRAQVSGHGSEQRFRA
jgi:glucose-6-phosphate isomerase